MKLTPEQHKILQDIYLQYGVSTDRLITDAITLQAITDVYSAKTGAAISLRLPKKLLNYMITARKGGKWVRLTAKPTRVSRKKLLAEIAEISIDCANSDLGNTATQYFTLIYGMAAGKT